MGLSLASIRSKVEPKVENAETVGISIYEYIHKHVCANLVLSGDNHSHGFHTFCKLCYKPDNGMKL